MIRFLADENFNGRIVRGIRLINPDAAIIRAQDTEIYEAPDPMVLEWAAEHGYIVLTHDVHTMIGFAYERIAAGLPMFGVIVVPQALAIGQVIDELLTMLGASTAEEWANRVEYLPF